MQQDETTNGERTSVNVSIDVAELEEIKALTGVDANATAILAAARQGRDFLKKVKASPTPMVIRQPQAMPMTEAKPIPLATERPTMRPIGTDVSGFRPIPAALNR